jgi:glycosyltransferase involved in cell wall biosynthesis
MEERGEQMKKKKLVFISNMASPYQVKFCYALQEFFDAEFWFYVRREPDRPKWWEIPLGDKCKVMSRTGYMPKVGYYALDVFSDLDKFRPDVILLGGFMNWHWLVMKWARRNNSKVVFMSEILRDTKHDHDASSSLMTRENSPQKIRAIRKIFGGADLYIGMGDTASKQFSEELGFPAEKIDMLSYPVDIDDYFAFSRILKAPDDPCTLLFANRLIARYQPLLALEIYKELSKRHPNLYIKLNNEGPLKSECESYIKKHGLKKASFLKDIDSWDDMKYIYMNADIFVLPATYSNGNLSIMEAGASGMGVVISEKINHMEEEMIDGYNCFIRKPETGEFIKCIEEYIKNPELLLRHGKNSKKLIEKQRNYYLAETYYNMFLKHGLLD